MLRPGQEVPPAVARGNLRRRDPRDAICATVEVISSATILGGVESLTEQRAKLASARSPAPLIMIVEGQVWVCDSADGRFQCRGRGGWPLPGPPRGRGRRARGRQRRTGRAACRRGGRAALASRPSRPSRRSRRLRLGAGADSGRGRPAERAHCGRGVSRQPCKSRMGPRSDQRDRHAVGRGPLLSEDDLSDLQSDETHAARRVSHPSSAVSGQSWGVGSGV
jgi:hypothetical protein